MTLWDVESATPRETLRGHSASVRQPVFSPDGETLYTASDDGTAIAWDVDGSRAAGAAVQVHARPGASIRCPTGTRGASARTDG